MKQPEIKLNLGVFSAVPALAAGLRELLQGAQDLVLLDKDDNSLGRVSALEDHAGVLFGKFERLPGFALIEPVFAELLDLVNQQVFSLVDQVEKRIDALGLRLEWSTTKCTVPVAEVQIADGSINFRLK